MCTTIQKECPSYTVDFTFFLQIFEQLDDRHCTESRILSSGSWILDDDHADDAMMTMMMIWVIIMLILLRMMMMMIMRIMPLMIMMMTVMIR